MTVLRIPSYALASAALCILSILTFTKVAHPNTYAQPESDTVAIRGQVINGTSGGEPPSGLRVFLLLIDEGDETIIERMDTITAADGTFAIEAPTATSDQFYRIAVDDGVFTPFKDALPKNIGAKLELTIFNRTTSLDDISVESYAMVIPVIDASETTVSVLASVKLINSGEHVYVADLEDPALSGFKLLRFNLPEGYRMLSVESDLPSGNLMEIGTGFALSNPVPPGEYNLLLSYQAPYHNDEFTYPLRLPFGAETVSILLPEGSGELQGLGLQNRGSVEINDRAYVPYQGEKYERGSQLDVTINGLPRPSSRQQLLGFFSSTQFSVALVASVAAALMLIAILTSLRILGQRSRGEAEFPEDHGPSAEREQIIVSIARLDEMHESGAIDEAAYLEERNVLMQRAVALNRNHEMRS